MQFPMMPNQPMPGMMGAMGMGMPAGWNPAMGVPGMAGVGPVRSHGRNNFNSRMPGPYARNDGRGNRAGGNRGPGMGMGSLPVVPPFGAIGGVAGLPGGEGGDGVGGVGGRMLKSYEDLDAADGTNGKTVELDY